jgi:hypothetical protein
LLDRPETLVVTRRIPEMCAPLALDPRRESYASMDMLGCWSIHVPLSHLHDGALDGGRANNDFDFRP